MRTFLPVAMLLIVSLAGCAEDEPDPEPLAPPQEVWQPYPYTFKNDASGCNLGVAVVMRDMAALAEFLPEGYVPADAQALLGTPTPTGDGAALFSIYSCAEASAANGTLNAAEINILIEEPTNNITADKPATAHYYLIEMVADNANVTAALADSEFNVLPGEAMFRFNGIPPRFGSQGSVVFNDTTYYVLNIPATVPSTLEGLSRFWQQTPNGTAYYDYQMTSQILVGHVACVFGAAIAVAVAGGSGCPQGQSLGITVQDLSWTSTFHYVPNVAPVPSPQGNATA